MMATKPRPVEEEEPAAAAPAVAKKPATSAEAIQDLERRLMGLGGEDEDKKEEEQAPPPALAAAPAPAVAPAAPEAAATAAEKAPSSGGGKGALLARIMAAQERARAAQEQQAALEATLAAHDKAGKSKEDSIMKALEGKEEELLPPPSIDTVAPPPPTFGAVEGTLPPPAAAAAAPPPAFGAVESTLPPSFAAVEINLPPSFGAVEKSIPPPAAAAATAPEASAPSFDLHAAEDDKPAAPPAPAVAEHNLLHEGFDNVLAPPPAAAESSAPPPTFEQIEDRLDEQLMDDEAFMLGEDGRPLSAEERKKMMEEQRAIMAAIQKESADNAAAIAAAQAEAFDQRSGPAVARVAGGGGPPPREAERATAIVGAETATDENGERTVDIGAGQNVALHGQERTKKAIAEGTAILVECMNCNNWMQVTESATLMFCPVCSTVSPVQKQSDVVTKDEAIQLTRDRQMAERLQAEINAELEGGGPRSSSSSRSAQRAPNSTANLQRPGLFGFMSPSMAEDQTQPPQQSASSSSGAGAASSKSWWDTISEYVSVGVSSQEHQPGHIGVSRPPGSTAAGMAAASAARSTTSSPSHVERQGLLNASVDRSAGAGLSPPRTMASMQGGGGARVAESKPLFSCIADSITSAATAVGESLTATNLSQDAEGNVHGVDSSGLLVTNVGREGGGGNYQQISDRDH